MERICRFCETGNITCYAEEALNETLKDIKLKPYDVGTYLCNEIDNEDDYTIVSQKIKVVEEKIVYMGFSTDVIHSGHIGILKELLV